MVMDQSKCQQSDGEKECIMFLLALTTVEY